MNKRKELITNTVNTILGQTLDTRVCGKLYRNTNEDLTTILSEFDFKNKEVLSVAASSDQIFSSYYLGAKSVDSFDQNLLAYFFFYLKKWTILSRGLTYIPAVNSELLEIIEAHDDSEEEIYVYKFWKNVINKIGKNSLYYSNLFYRAGLFYYLPYSNDIEKISKIIKSKKANFKKINLFERFDIQKKYDIVILSNILEYMYEEENEELNKLVADNIYNLINDDGIIISSNILGIRPKYDESFEKKFELSYGPKNYNTISLRLEPVSYTYRKKR